MNEEINLAPGEGKIIEENGRPIAAYNDNGQIKKMSAKCPHKSCNVAWHSSQKDWYCPCHGSRFTPTGQVTKGPATEDLRSL